jgi:transposase
MRKACTITLTAETRKQLVRWSRGRSTPVRLMQRARIVLRAAEGMENKDIAQELGTTRRVVARWRNRFADQGTDGIIQDAPRSGRKPTKRNMLVRKIIEATTQTTPTNATHWSTRTLAEHLNTTQSMVQRVWKANNLKPHLIKTFKVSNDKLFIEKTLDVIGLYLNPPENALVLCVDEKTQIQALDRTQPGLPLKKGRAGTMTHDYKRNGTTTLFAALDIDHGKVIGECKPRHRHQEWLAFLKKIEAETPKDVDLHLVIDNYSTHKHENVRRWLAKHPRFHIHLIPTSSSWMNMVERWFRELTDKQIRRGVFHSVDELVSKIMSYIEQYNQQGKPFIWTMPAEDIIEKVKRARKVLDKIPSE